MADADGAPGVLGELYQVFELSGDRCGIVDVVKEDVAPRIAHGVFRGEFLGDRAYGGSAVDEVEPRMAVHLFHEPLHVAGMLRDEAAHMVVDADDMGNGFDIVLDGALELPVGHVQRHAARPQAVAFDRFHGQVQQHLLAGLVRRIGQPF